MAKSRVDAENLIKTLFDQVVSVVDIKVRHRFEQIFCSVYSFHRSWP